LTADIVPLEWRGRYFGTRNMAMGIANIVITLLAGQIITASGNSIAGYQAVFGLAVVFGAVSSFSFAHIQEPRRAPNPAAMTAYKPRELLQTLTGNPFFLRYVLAQMVWNFSIQIAGPFFGVYQLEILGSTAAIIGVQAIISPLAALPAQPLFGRLNDRWGARRVLNLTGFLVPVLPALWIFTRGPWDPLPLNIFGGIVWAGYSIANFNFLLSTLPHENSARYIAVFQALMLLSASVGAALGGVVIDLFDYRLMFGLSAAGRLAGHVMLFFLFRSSPPAQHPETGETSPPEDESREETPVTASSGEETADGGQSIPFHQDTAHPQVQDLGLSERPVQAGEAQTQPGLDARSDHDPDEADDPPAIPCGNDPAANDTTIDDSAGSG